MSRLNTYEKIVKDILRDHEETRANDRRLYLKLLETLGYDTHATVEEFFLDDDYPNLESIRRVRQKIQEKCPGLRPPEDVRNGRRNSEAEYLEYVHE